MKKELKELIKSKKLTDDQLIKIINSTPESESEKDVLEEDDESEEQSDSKETDKAESTPAAKEETKKPNKVLTMDDLTALIDEKIKSAIKKPINEKPKATQQKIEGGLYIEGYGVIPMSEPKK